mmetsp:Transcript_29790/g.85716  ORF Transcript_29790/g.85716 Transcript_29790/m.85716 type:complete len:238 (-) Transcript_29790:624-1337(-)
MLHPHHLLLGLSLPLGGLLLRLHLDDALELVPLELGLLRKPPLLLSLLPLPGDTQLLVDLLLLHLLSLLLLPRCPLSGLARALGAEGVHLRRLVLSLLLHRAELCRLLLLLCGDPLLLLFELPLPRGLVLLVLDDFLLLDLLREHFVLFDLHRGRIRLMHLLHQPLRSQLLLPLLLNLLRLQGLDLLEDECALLIALLLLAHPLTLAVLDLLDDYLRPAALTLKALFLPLLIHLQGF